MEQINNYEFQKEQASAQEEKARQEENREVAERVDVEKIIIPQDSEVSDEFNINNIINFRTRELNKIAEQNKNKTKEEVLTEEEQDIRSVSIYNEGVRYGAQAALYRVLNDFNDLVKRNESTLSEAINFQPLMLLEGKVQPPVILESRNNFYKESQLSTRKIKQSYKIEKQVEVRNSSKSFHEYLIVNPVKPKEISPVIFPRNTKEKKEWSNGVIQGWKKGIKQANNIIIQNIRELTSDYVGMVRFHLMEKSGIVSNPVAQTLNRGVNTDGSNINIGEVEFKVTNLPEFNADVETWKALPKVESLIEVK